MTDGSNNTTDTTGTTDTAGTTGTTDTAGTTGTTDTTGTTGTTDTVDSALADNLAVISEAPSPREEIISLLKVDPTFKSFEVVDIASPYIANELTGYFTFQLGVEVFRSKSSTGGPTASKLRTHGVFVHTTSDYFTGLAGKWNAVQEAEGALELFTATTGILGSTLLMMTHAQKWAQLRAVGDVVRWHDKAQKDGTLALEYAKTDGESFTDLENLRNFQVNGSQAMGVHRNVLAYNTQNLIAKSLEKDLIAESSDKAEAYAAWGDSLYNGSWEVQRVFWHLENEFQYVENIKNPEDLKLAKKKLARIKDNFDKQADLLVKSEIRLAMAEVTGDNRMATFETKAIASAKEKLAEVKETIVDFNKEYGNIDLATDANLKTKFDKVIAFGETSYNFVKAGNDKQIAKLTDAYKSVPGLTPGVLHRVPTAQAISFSAADFAITASKWSALGTDAFAKASNEKKAEQISGAIGMTLWMASDIHSATGHKFADTNWGKTFKGAKALANGLGSAAFAVGAGLRIKELYDLMDDPSLTQEQRDAYALEATLETAAAAMAGAQGVIENVVTYTSAVGKYAKYTKVLGGVSIVLGAASVVASALDPQQWQSFKDQKKYAEAVAAQGDMSSQVLGAGLSKSVDIRQDYFIAKNVVDGFFSLAAGVLGTMAVTVPLGMVAGIIGGFTTLLLDVIEAERLKKLAREAYDKITEGGRTVDEFFAQKLSNDFDATKDRFTPFFEKIVATDRYDNAALLGSQLLNANDFELIGFARAQGEVTRWSGNFGSSYTEAGWNDDHVHVEENQFKASTVTFSSESERGRYVTASTPYLSGELQGYITASEGFSFNLVKVINIGETGDFVIPGHKTGTYHGWAIVDDDSDSATTFDIKNFVNKFVYEHRTIEQKKSLYVQYKDVEKHIDHNLRIEGKGGDDTFIARGVSVDFSGGEGKDTAVYSALNTEDLAGGITIRKNASTDPKAPLTVVVNMAAGSKYWVEKIVIVSPSDLYRSETTVHELRERVSNEKRYDELSLVETIAGSNLDDSIDLSGHSKSANKVATVHGMAGDDWIVGDDVTSILTGGAGNDVLDPTKAIEKRLSDLTNVLETVLGSGVNISQVLTSTFIDKHLDGLLAGGGDGRLTHQVAYDLQEDVAEVTGVWAYETLQALRAADKLTLELAALPLGTAELQDRDGYQRKLRKAILGEMIYVDGGSGIDKLLWGSGPFDELKETYGEIISTLDLGTLTAGSNHAISGLTRLGAEMVLEDDFLNPFSQMIINDIERVSFTLEETTFPSETVLNLTTAETSSGDKTAILVPADPAGFYVGNGSLTVANLTQIGGEEAGVSVHPNGGTINGSTVSGIFLESSFYTGLAVGEEKVITLSYDVVDANGGSEAHIATITVTGSASGPAFSATTVGSMEHAQLFETRHLSGVNAAEDSSDTWGDMQNRMWFVSDYQNIIEGVLNTSQSHVALAPQFKRAEYSFQKTAKDSLDADKLLGLDPQSVHEEQGFIGIEEIGRRKTIDDQGVHAHRKDMGYAVWDTTIQINDQDAQDLTGEMSLPIGYLADGDEVLIKGKMYLKKGAQYYFKDTSWGSSELKIKIPRDGFQTALETEKPRRTDDPDLHNIGSHEASYGNSFDFEYRMKKGFFEDLLTTNGIWGLGYQIVDGQTRYENSDHDFRLQIGVLLNEAPPYEYEFQPLAGQDGPPTAYTSVVAYEGLLPVYADETYDFRLEGSAYGVLQIGDSTYSGSQLSDASYTQNWSGLVPFKLVIRQDQNNPSGNELPFTRIPQMNGASDQ